MFALLCCCFGRPPKPVPKRAVDRIHRCVLNSVESPDFDGEVSLRLRSAAQCSGDRRACRKELRAALSRARVSSHRELVAEITACLVDLQPVDARRKGRKT